MRANLQTALQHDASKPANCFTVLWDGSSSEEICLDLNHPMTPGVPTLFVGQTYVRRNNHRGCIYRPLDDKVGMVRRAALSAIQHDSRTNYFLREPDDVVLPLIVYVNLAAPANIKFKERFATRIVPQERIVMENSNEFLLTLNKGDVAEIYLPDGQVIRLSNNGTLVVEKLPIEQQAAARIAHTESLLADTKHLEGNRRIKAEDYAHHQLISIMAVAGKYSEPILNRLFQDLSKILESGVMRPSVREHFLAVLKKDWPALALKLRLPVDPAVISIPTSPYADKPRTIKQFNQIFESEGEDAACLFAAWSGVEKLLWAAEKVRVGEWNPGGVGSGHFVPKLAPRIGKTEKSGGKQAADKKRAARKARDIEDCIKRGKIPRPGQQDGHSARKQKKG